MKVYHVETQQAYDELMIELENKGYTWNSDAKPKNYNGFKWYEESTLIITRDKELKIVFDSISLYVCNEGENIIEYKAKGEKMKLYHTKTQFDYDALMIELEEKGYKWLSGDKPTCFNYWKQEEENSCVEISDKDITFGSIEWHKKEYPDTPIIEYKAKVESDLQEDKLSAKKLIEKIGEFLETLNLVFKVGDYVTVEVSGRKIITKIDELTENKTAFGLWYDEPKNIVKQDFWFLTEGNIFSHSTPEEIAEYESALSFHKHGRKPFELKRGDVVYLKGYDKNIFLDSGNIYKKHNFINGDVILVKTVEEVNEWLENK